MKYDTFFFARTFYFWLAVIVAVGAAARLLGLDGPSVYLDELFTVRDAALLVQEPAEFIFRKVRALGYAPVALGLWLRGVDLNAISPESASQWLSAGIDATAMRFIPAVIGSITVGILGWISAPILGRRTALIAALLLALAPWHIYWSQTARFYILQLLLYTVALLYYYRGSRDLVAHRSLAKLSVAAIALILALITQLTSIVLVVVIVIDLVVSKLRGERLAIGTAGYIVIGASVVICTALLVMAGYWENAQGWYARAAETIAASGVRTPVYVMASSAYFIGPAVLITASLACLSKSGTDRGLIWYLAIAAFAPMVVFAILSLTRDYFGSRYAFTCLFPWLALAAIGIRQFFDEHASASGMLVSSMPLALVLVAAMLMNASYYVYNPGFRPHWKEAFEHVRANREPNAAVYVDGGRILVAQYYLETDDIERMFTTSEPQARPAWFVTDAGSPSEMRLGRRVPVTARFEKSYVTSAIDPIHAIYVFYAEE